MAECHPVGFQWVMEAKARGATVIHVDPRFTRTSAVADLHVPLRAGSDIVFLGAIINYVLANEKYFACIKRRPSGSGAPPPRYWLRLPARKPG
jgi:formate dehydrogenase major subunit